MTASRWAQPTEVSDLQMAIPAGISNLLPPLHDIPADFTSHSPSTAAVIWLRFQQDWFAPGLHRPRFEARDGVDARAAYRHLAVLQGSYEPKHEHKMAAVAWLASLWFERVVTDDATYVSVGVPEGAQ